MNVIPARPRVPQAVYAAAVNVARVRKAKAATPAERRANIRRAKARLKAQVHRWRKAEPRAYAAVTADLRRRAAAEERKAA